MISEFKLEPMGPAKRAPRLPDVPEFKEDRMPPLFTFPLRMRLIQKNHPCKLICTVQGNPIPKVSLNIVYLHKVLIGDFRSNGSKMEYQ